MTKNYAETPVAEQLQDLILSNEDVDDFLEDLAVFSSDILGGAVEVHCGVTLKRDKRALTVASSSAQAKLERVMPAKLNKRLRAIDETVTLDLSRAAPTGDNGALAFDLERLNELGFQEGRYGGALGATGMQRIVVTEADHPWLDAWWPPGHVLGWDHTFTNQAADFLTAIGRGEQPRPSLADGLAVQRVLAAIEESAGRDGARVEVINGAPKTQED